MRRRCFECNKFVCDDKNICTKITEDRRHQYKREKSIDAMMSFYNTGYLFELNEGQYIKLRRCFLSEPWIKRRFCFKHNQIYMIENGGIYDENRKFLDLNIHEVKESTLVGLNEKWKIIEPIRKNWRIVTEGICDHYMNGVSKQRVCEEFRQPIENFYYEKSLHKQCKICYDFYQNENKKTKNALALLNTIRTPKK